jgi:hypothetical protein
MLPGPRPPASDRSDPRVGPGAGSTNNIRVRARFRPGSNGSKKRLYETFRVF